jgi:hypothetical protein
MRLISIFLALAAGAAAQVKITPETDRVRVEIDGKPFTDFVLRGGEAMKPYLWPLRAASGTMVTRHFPMETVAGEPADHPHQRGLWFAHDHVNGVDFWNNESSYKAPPPRGHMVVDKITNLKNGGFTADMHWLDPQGATLVDESRVMTFTATPKLRIVDFHITLTAATKVVFGDSKDGVFGVRLAPALQEDKVIKTKGKPDVILPGPPGTITNADGAEHEKAVWGKPSNWVDYSGEIDGEKLGIAIFDHPSNSRRARWHVRAYGLFAANPFGLSAFTGDKSQDGSVTLEPGQKLHFRYRVVIHPGDAKSAGLAKLWDEFSK